MNDIAMNAIAAVMVIICVAAGIWAWWLENGPAPRDKNKKDDNEEEEDGHEED